MSVNHYENFPVGSLVMPRRLRKPTHAVYTFARTADDLADEGNAEADERLRALTNSNPNSTAYSAVKRR